MKFTVSVACTVLALADASAIADPFPAFKAGEWNWVQVAGTTCMDGTETGAYIKRHGSGNSTGLGIYHEGGGACFNGITCASASASAHPGKPGKGGIFSDTDSRNPFKGFDWVWVPYCTGDVHNGAVTKRYELEHRHFQGRANIAAIMDRAVATWPSLDQLVVTGESAGGFGAAAGYDFIRSHWQHDDVRALMLDDSGPVLDDTAVAVCLQHEWREIWNINASLPPGCPCITDEGNLVAAWKYIASKWPKDSYALISSVKDAVISEFFSFGESDCKSPLPGVYDKLEDGLKRLSATGVPTYMIPGDVHEHTGDKEEFYTKVSAGVKLYEWVGALMADGPDPPSVIPK